MGATSSLLGTSSVVFTSATYHACSTCGQGFLEFTVKVHIVYIHSQSNDVKHSPSAVRDRSFRMTAVSMTAVSMTAVPMAACMLDSRGHDSCVRCDRPPCRPHQLQVFLAVVTHVIMTKGSSATEEPRGLQSGMMTEGSSCDDE